MTAISDGPTSGWEFVDGPKSVLGDPSPLPGTVSRGSADSVRYEPHALDRDEAVYVAGHRGLVGSAIVRRLESGGFRRIVTRTHQLLDLRDRDAVFEFFADARPRHVILAAARVGGIAANDSDPTGFLTDNLRIQVNVIDAALRYDVERFLFLGSSCIYPRLAQQPISEDQLLSGHLEPTNDAYAIAKIAGIVHIKSIRRQYGKPWISAMPTNLYGPGDNFSASSSHVLAALIRRYDDAVSRHAPAVTNWGTGNPRREFLHVDDLADACLHLMEHYDGPTHVNIGTGVDLTIRDLASIVADEVGFNGVTQWDHSKPDGTPRKLLDLTLLHSTGWSSRIDLDEGIGRTVRWYRRHGSAQLDAAT